MESEKLLTEVPEPLKRLTRLIVRGFYSQQHAIVIDLIVRVACIKEDDIIELLRFERKQLRALINTLKNDKFVKAQMRVETDAEGKTTRHNYYFVNYNLFVNVVKYKLDHVRRKIEMEERDNTSRASFRCPSCQKTYTDLEAGQLLDFMTQTLKCTFCDTEVEEDETSMPKQDARTLLAKFNEQIQPIYDLLKECEDYKLAPEVLAPEPIDIRKNILRNQTTSGSKGPADKDNATWSGDSTRNIGFNYSESSVTINMNEDSFKSPTKDKKERPIWMTTSTIEGIPMLDSQEIDNSRTEAGTSKETTNLNREDIMQTLLVHEAKASAAGGLPASAKTEDSSSSDSDEDKSIKPSSSGVVEEMDSEDEDDNVAMVTIGNKKVLLHEVTESMVALMTQAEKDEYIRLSQEMYEDMYE